MAFLLSKVSNGCHLGDQPLFRYGSRRDRNFILAILYYHFIRQLLLPYMYPSCYDSRFEILALHVTDHVGHVLMSAAAPLIARGWQRLDDLSSDKVT